MSHAPGYHALMAMCDAPLLPTPAAMGNMVSLVAKKRAINLMAVDIGGATTDVFSIFDGAFNKSVSANFGMSYSLANVLEKAGSENIVRWLPFEIDLESLGNALYNKMVRPTTIPATLRELLLEQAVAREAIRLSVENHLAVAVGLKGVKRDRTISEILDSTDRSRTIVDFFKLDLLIGSGGVLSHAPNRGQAAMMLVDSFQPVGVTLLAIDSIFMMPQLGALSKIHPQAAEEVFENDCLIELGTCIAPVGPAHNIGAPWLEIELEHEGKRSHNIFVAGDIQLIRLPPGKTADATLKPLADWDLGAGVGKPVCAKLRGGVVGLVFDTRGRPITFPDDVKKRLQIVATWLNNLSLY